jgi:hypothetical protein
VTDPATSDTRPVRGRRRWPSVPVLVALALPLLLAVAVAAVGVVGRVQGVERAGLGSAGGTATTAAAAPETGPLAVVPVEAPDAGGPDCSALLAALPAELPAGSGTLPTRPLADPAPPGTRAWAAAPRPAVLRCGLTRPAELTPTSALLEVNGVRWLRLDDGVPDPVIVTYVAVDRPVYVVLTAPTDAGSGPLQAVADVVRQTLSATDVAVR